MLSTESMLRHDLGRSASAFDLLMPPSTQSGARSRKSRFPITIGATIRTCQYNLVTIEITQPDLPVIGATITVRWIPVTRHNNLNLQRFGSGYRGIYIVDFKPE